MATFVTLLKYTEQGIKTIKESPSRLEKAKQALKSLGGELKSFHLVQGRYDAIVIFEVPNDDVAAKFALSTGSQGNVRTESMRAFTEEEYRRIISGLP
ncbi:MAG TPA: GYD domain-containing protein [Myxococcales bacterium]